MPKVSVMMCYSSDGPNHLSSPLVRMPWADSAEGADYPLSMPRNAPQNRPEPDWFLPEWMATVHINQAELARRAGLSKATMSDIFHGRTNYYRDLVNRIATALNLAPYELLMPPERAMSLRRFQQDAVRIAADMRMDYTPEPSGMRTGTHG